MRDTGIGQAFFFSSASSIYVIGERVIKTCACRLTPETLRGTRSMVFSSGDVHL
jgi:hypothetical protein